MEMRFKSVAVVTILLFLFGVSIASAADRGERMFSKPGKSPVHMLQVGKRQGHGGGGLEHFLKTLGNSGCESSCCWATANCDGADTECSATRCDAWCGDGSHAGYSCLANET
jgi:hypothetical protein